MAVGRWSIKKGVEKAKGDRVEELGISNTEDKCKELERAVDFRYERKEERVRESKKRQPGD